MDPLQFGGNDASLYRAMFNNPIVWLDSEGLIPVILTTEKWDSLVSSIKEIGMPLITPQESGRYFERAILRLLGLRPYLRSSLPDFRSTERFLKSGINRVIPDAIASQNSTEFTIGSFASIDNKILFNSVFIDAKRTNRNISESSYKWEATGYADVLGKQAIEVPHAVRRKMIYVLTKNGSVSKALGFVFTKKLVALYSAYAYYDDSTCEISIGPLTHVNATDVPERPFLFLRSGASHKVDWKLVAPFASGDKDTTEDY